MAKPNLRIIAPRRGAGGGSGGNGRNGGGTHQAERLARIEERVRHLATAAELEKTRHAITGLKVWLLLGILGGVTVGAALALAVAQLLF